MSALIRRHALLAEATNNPVALSIYNKISEWYSCNALSGGNLVGQHVGKILTAENDGGSATIVAGHIGNGVDIAPSYGFYGASADVAGTVNSTSPTSTAAWYRPDSLAANAFISAIRVGNSIQGRDHRLLMYVDTSGGVHAFAGNGTTFVDAGATANTLSVGTFGFCQAEVTPNGGAGLLRSRLNDGTWKTGTPLSTSPTANAAYRLGFDYSTADGTATGYSNGVLDEVAYFNAALTNAEWDYLYNSGAGISYAALKTAAGH